MSAFYVALRRRNVARPGVIVSLVVCLSVFPDETWHRSPLTISPARRTKRRRGGCRAGKWRRMVGGSWNVKPVVMLHLNSCVRTAVELWVKRPVRWMRLLCAITSRSGGIKNRRRGLLVKRKWHSVFPRPSPFARFVSLLLAAQFICWHAD